jgi:hypothetical protein
MKYFWMFCAGMITAVILVMTLPGMFHHALILCPTDKGYELVGEGKKFSIK